MHHSRALTALLIAAVVLAFVAAPSTAQTWTGAVNGSWANAANWSPVGIPVSGQDMQLTFGSAVTTSMTNDVAGPFAFKQLTFNAGDPAYSLTGNDLSALTSSGNVPAAVVMNSANSLTLGNNITLTNPLTVSGTGAAPIALNGVISGGGLTYSAPGTLTLGNAANTYSGGTNVQNGTVSVASDAALGSGNVTGGAPGTVNFTGTTTTAKSFAMNGGTVSVAAGKTLTFNGSVGSSAFLDGAGTFATSATNGAQFVNVTATQSVAITSNSAADQFVHFTNSGTLNVAPAVGSFFQSGSLPTGVTFNGFTNHGLGSVTVSTPGGGGSFLNVSNFQTYGTMTVNPAPYGSGQFSLLTNVGDAPLGFNAGSRTLLGSTTPLGEGPPIFLAGIDLHGQNALIVGGLLINNGFIADLSSGPPGTIIVDYGALLKTSGYVAGPVITQNGGKVQAGNSPGTASFGRFVFGPGGVSNYVFDINDATGAAGANSNANGWGLVKAVQQSVLGTATSSGNFTWTASPAAKLTVAIDTIVGTTTGDTDIAGPMGNFDPTRSYSWLAAQWAGTYSGPTDATMLDAATSFDTSGFLNPIAGTFGWSLDPAGQTLSLVYTPSPVPEPSSLFLAAAAAHAVFLARRLRRNL